MTDKLTINNLWKKYATGKVAVEDLSITMYKNQIFALLGHNGAGKTTTMSMLTGMIEPSAGEAFAFGTSIFDDLDAVWKDLGVCPQFDILFEMLTPEEHL